MDYLWTPWRYTYVSEVDKNTRKGIPEELSAWPDDKGCVFCNMIGAVDYATAQGMPRDAAEKAAGIVFRGEHNYVCLNRYPYTSGHMMVVPYAHQSSLAALDAAAGREMMELARRLETVLGGIYHPDGFNIGMNLGRAAGAGIANHLHLHALPRWFGDTNFLTAVSETRLLPEDLALTWERVRKAFAGHASNSVD